MRIVKIEVKKLFDIPSFNYKIDFFKSDERITIIHGPNGSGKTVIFKMISGLFDLNNILVFWQYPFEEFKVLMDDNSYILVSRKYDQKNQRFLHPVFMNSQFPDQKFSLDGKILRLMSRVLPLSIRRRLDNIESTSLDDAIESYEEFIIAQKIYNANYIEADFFDYIAEKSKFPDWLRYLSSKIKVNFIQANRLQTDKVSDETFSNKRGSKTSVATIAENAVNLASRINAKILEAEAVGESLNRSFPSRIIEMVIPTNTVDLPRKNLKIISYKAIRDLIKNLEQTRKNLISVGLLEENQADSNLKIPEKIMSSTKETTLRSFLSLYIQDTFKKFDVYSDLAAKIDLFKDILNGMLQHKKIQIGKNGYEIKNDQNREIPLEELSSGEQHILVLMYNLLFKDTDNSTDSENVLFLIDEPEISLHIVWQKRFISDLTRISRLSGFDAIIATHSPSIINGRLDLMVAIQGSTHNE